MTMKRINNKQAQKNKKINVVLQLHFLGNDICELLVSRQAFAIDKSPVHNKKQNNISTSIN